MASQEKNITICRRTLKFFKYSLLWPSEGDEINPSKWYYIRITTFLLVTSGWVLSLGMHVIMTIKSASDAPKKHFFKSHILDNVDVYISEDIAFLVCFVGIYYMTIIYVKNQSKVAFLLRDLSNFEKFGPPPGFKEEEKRLAFWVTFIFLYTIIGGSFYNLVKIYEKGDCEKINEEKGLEENCGFFSSVWFPFKIDYFPVYHLLCLYILVSALLLMKTAWLISFNALEMGHHIILRINHLNTMIRECFDDEDYEVSRKKLNACISYHSDILNLSARLDDCFSMAMLAHLTVTAGICGCLEKQYVDNDNRICAVTHICGWFMALYTACVGGQDLIDASNSIPEAIWSSKWYQVDTRLQKDLLFMLQRSQKELYISAGSFGVMSYPLFVSVVKMSYSILAVLTS